MRRNPFSRGAATLGVLLMAVTLGACGRGDEARSPGQKIDAAIGKVDDQVDAAKVQADKALAEAKRATTEAVHAAANAVEDTTITSTVRYKLGTDIGIRSTELTVETHGGRVLLRGTAPDAASRERAAQVAAAVQGVLAVDNQVTVAR